MTARAALYAGGFLGPFGGGMVTVLVPELRDAFGVSTSAASLALTAYLVPFAGLQLISGTLGERFGRARATRAAFFAYAAASLAAAAVGSYPLFLISRAVQGAANAFTTPLILAGLADATPEAGLGRAVGTFASVQTAGVVCAPLIGGLAGSVDYRLAFVVAAAAALALTVVRVPAGSGAPGEVRLRSALTPRAVATAASALLWSLSTIGLSVVVALRAGDELGLGPTGRGVLLAGFGVAGVLAGRVAGDVADRRGPVAVAVAGALGCAALVPWLGAVPTTAALGALWLAAGAGSALLATGINTLAVGSAPANRGGAVSLVGALRHGGTALAPVLWLPLYAAQGEVVFVVAGALCVVLALTTLHAGAAAVVRG